MIIDTTFPSWRGKWTNIESLKDRIKRELNNAAPQSKSNVGDGIEASSQAESTAVAAPEYRCNICGGLVHGPYEKPSIGQMKHLRDRAAPSLTKDLDMLEPAFEEWCERSQPGALKHHYWDCWKAALRAKVRGMATSKP